MAEENGQAPPAQQPSRQGVPVFSNIQCPACNEQMAVRMPMTNVFNSIPVSMVVFSHERLDRCANCGATYLCTIDGLNEQGSINLKWKRIETKESAIVPPTPSNMAKALDLDNSTKGMKKQ